MEKVIKIKGIGRMDYRPDTCKVSISLRYESTNYLQAVEGALEKVEDLAEAVEKAGLDKLALKVERMRCDCDKEIIKDKKGREKGIITTFVTRQLCHVSFDINDEVLSIIMEKAIELDGNISLSYTLKNIEKAKNDLLESAVLDGYMKANIIAKNGNAKVTGLVSANYGVEEHDFCVERDYDVRVYKKQCLMPTGFNPDDIHCSEEITLVFGLE